MRKYLECELCDKTFRNRRALAGHMRLAHNVLMGEKQEIKDHLGRLQEMTESDGKLLVKLADKVDDLDERLKDIEEMLDGLDKDLTENEKEEKEIEEVPSSNPLDLEKLKQDVKTEIKKELEEEKIKAEEKTVKPEEEKKEKEEEDKSWFF